MTEELTDDQILHDRLRLDFVESCGHNHEEKWTAAWAKTVRPAIVAAREEFPGAQLDSIQQRVTGIVVDVAHQVGEAAKGATAMAAWEKRAESRYRAAGGTDWERDKAEARRRHLIDAAVATHGRTQEAPDLVGVAATWRG